MSAEGGVHGIPEVGVCHAGPGRVGSGAGKGAVPTSPREREVPGRKIDCKIEVSDKNQGQPGKDE